MKKNMMADLSKTCAVSKTLKTSTVKMITTRKSVAHLVITEMRLYIQKHWEFINQKIESNWKGLTSSFFRSLLCPNLFDLGARASPGCKFTRMLPSLQLPNVSVIWV